MGAAMTEPVQQSLAHAGAKLSWWEWHAQRRGSGPSMVFAHATGFHGRVWDAIIEHFPTSHIAALDLRGHGASSGGPIEHWQVLADDIAAVLGAIGAAEDQPHKPIGIGHSMGAHALLQVQADLGCFDRLVLFDPVILDPAWYESGSLSFDDSQPHPSIRRKRYFASPEAMVERFRARDPYELFDPRVLRDYCQYGLIEAGSKGGPVAEAEERYELACAPEVEASVYMSSRSNAGIHAAARSVEIPVTIVRAKQTDFGDFKSSPTWPKLAESLPSGRDLYRPDMTHFHPFQDPADAARIIKEG
jgi:pimeloyl-ACP methyl ester carboxylesterase